MASVVDVLNILILHSLGDESEAPFFLKHQVYMLQKYHPEHNYLYHDVALPLPSYVREINFDLIVLDVTLLCFRWSPIGVLDKLKADYEFVKYSDAVKIAFPQDEYDCNQILDDWMVAWNVDIVYSVISDNWEVLYPTYHKVGCIKLAYTGYIDESLIDWKRKPFELRKIDIGYRARNLLPYFGRIGQIKSSIALDVLLKASPEENLYLDIAVGDKSTLNGVDWLEFINNSKFTLGSNSGSSLLDPRGDIQKKVRGFLLDHPRANFEEVEKFCFPGEDGKYQFTAISPRVMEAALLDSCQILVKGNYSGLLEPWKNYIPIEPDASNWDEVYLAMQDRSLVQEIIKETRSKILDTQELRSKEKSQKILVDMFSLQKKRAASSSVEMVRIVIDKYKSEMNQKAYNKVWLKRRLRKRIIASLEDYPRLQLMAKKIYNKIRYDV